MSAQPTPQQVRRSLARAERGAALDVAEAAVLLAARGEDLDRLCAAAARVRDAGLVAAGRPGVVTYSPKVFVPVTRLCRDRCHYCTFVTDARPPRRAGEAMFLSPDEILDVARAGAELGCLEALFTLGDRPEDRWPEARAWLDEQGYDSTLAYVRAMAIRVLEETGLLPHLNPGVMSWEEMNRLKPVAPSMGMMLETTSRRLFEDRARPTTARRTRTPTCGCGCSRTPAGSRSRSRPACWSASARTSPSGPRRSSRCARIAPRHGRAGGDRPELPGQARHRDAPQRRPRPRRVPRRDRRHPAGAGPEGPGAGPAEPGRPGASRCRAWPSWTITSCTAWKRREVARRAKIVSARSWSSPMPTDHEERRTRDQPGVLRPAGRHPQCVRGAVFPAPVLEQAPEVVSSIMPIEGATGGAAAPRPTSSRRG